MVLSSQFLQQFESMCRLKMDAGRSSAQQLMPFLQPTCPGFYQRVCPESLEALLLSVSLVRQQESPLWLAACDCSGEGVGGDLVWVLPENANGQTSLHSEYLLCESPKPHDCGGVIIGHRLALRENHHNQRALLRVVGNVPDHKLLCKRKSARLVPMRERQNTATSTQPLQSGTCTEREHAASSNNRVDRQRIGNGAARKQRRTHLGHVADGDVFAGGRQVEAVHFVLHAARDLTVATAEVCNHQRGRSGGKWHN
ncbi:hypothetical protein EYF80_026785 [Liparis tanakae]|uniref:Uncharacterized protein n=1 Tax=Liparis tanakae TaxID=230148 RepID=A0A4Z2HB36_9TELE|nr:hypothetical protein EYF80_026785 [Liparis tanakae]